MQKTAKLKLDFPVQLADRLLEEIEMRRPTMGDMLDYPINGSQDFAGEMALYAALCGLRAEDLRHLDAEDYSHLQELMASFRSAPDSGRKSTRRGAALSSDGLDA